MPSITATSGEGEGTPVNLNGKKDLFLLKFSVLVLKSLLTYRLNFAILVLVSVDCMLHKALDHGVSYPESNCFKFAMKRGVYHLGIIGNP